MSQGFGQITYPLCFGVMDHVGDKGHSISIIVAGWYPNLLVRLCPSIPLVVVTSPFPLPLPNDTCTNLSDWFPHFWFSQFLILSSTDKHITVFVCPLACDNGEVGTHNLTKVDPMRPRWWRAATTMLAIPLRSGLLDVEICWLTSV